jgi:exonuclease III
MRIVTLNVNGILAAARAFRLARTAAADVVCLRARPGRADAAPQFHLSSTTASTSRRQAIAASRSLPPGAGRGRQASAGGFVQRALLEARFGDLSIVSVYAVGFLREAAAGKFRFMTDETIWPIGQDAAQEAASTSGDWTSPTEIDLKRRSIRNSDSSEERAGSTTSSARSDSRCSGSESELTVHLISTGARPEERRMAHRLPDRHAGPKALPAAPHLRTPPDKAPL